MATMVQIGPADDGRVMTLEEFEAGDYQPGYKYELIDGELYVSPEANQPEDYVEKWLFGCVFLYRREHPEVINHVTDKARVFIPGRPGETCPEPDLVAYHRYPHGRSTRIRWQDISPRLVAEVLSGDDPRKDFIRNVALYLQVPSIKEYWILDGRRDARFPSLRVHRRRGKSWDIFNYSGGETYTTKLLPGFKLTLDTRP